MVNLVSRLTMPQRTNMSMSLFTSKVRPAPRRNSKMNNLTTLTPTATPLDAQSKCSSGLNTERKNVSTRRKLESPTTTRGNGLQGKLIVMASIRQKVTRILRLPGPSRMIKLFTKTRLTSESTCLTPIVSLLSQVAIKRLTGSMMKRVEPPTRPSKS